MIFFGLDIARDKMEVVIVYYVNKHLSTFQKISLLLGLCDVGYGNRKALRASGAGRAGGCFTKEVGAGLRL